MKKLLCLMLVIFSFFLFADPAFALQTRVQQSGQSDEVWTEVKIGDGYTTIVSRGHVLVASITGVTVGDNDGFLARHSSASTDAHILGVAQQPITSGETRIILARGRGVVNVQGGGAVSSGDVLAVDGTGTGRASYALTTHLGKTRFATALEAVPGDDEEAWSYIHVV